MSVEQPSPPKGRPALLFSQRTLILGIVAVVLIAIAVPFMRQANRGEIPETPEQSVQKGLVLNKQQQYDAAISEFTKAIQARPEMADAYLYRGIVRFEAGYLEDSITDFNTVLQLGSGRAVVYLYRGDSYLALGQRDQAAVDYKNALALAGDDEQMSVTARSKLFLMGANE